MVEHQESQRKSNRVGVDGISGGGFLNSPCFYFACSPSPVVGFQIQTGEAGTVDEFHGLDAIYIWSLWRASQTPTNCD
jgi:hypothetical protein